MISIALALTLQQSLISIPMGYYTLAELGAMVEKQGTKVKVASVCRSDIYAVRLKDLPVKGLKDALVADERLTIRENDGTWEIDRSSSTGTAESVALRKYQRTVGDTLQRVYSTATKRMQYLSTLSKEQRDAEVDRLSATLSNNPEAAAIRNAVYLGAYGEIPFSQLATITAFTNPKSAPVFNKLLLSTWFDSPALVSPTGSLADVPGSLPIGNAPGDREAFFRNFQFGAKLVVDPVTLAVAYRQVGYIKRDSMLVTSSGQPALLAPGEIKIPITIEALWDRAGVQAQAKRVSESEALLATLEDQKGASVGNRPQPVSSALLKVAEGAGLNLITYVPAFSDFWLSGQASARIPTILSDANATGIDLEWVREVVRERVSPVDEDWKAAPVVSTLRRYTISSAGGVFVVRNETRFLDSWSASPNPPTAFSNALLAGKKIALTDVMAHVSGLNPKAWSTSMFSSRYLDVCNPLAFRPFAAALAKSPALKSVLTGDDGSIAYAKLDPAARSAFEQALGECSELSDSFAGDNGNGVLPDPLMALVTLKDSPPQSLSIRVSDVDGKYTFALYRGEAPLWLAVLSNVNLRS